MAIRINETKLNIFKKNNNYKIKNCLGKTQRNFKKNMYYNYTKKNDFVKSYPKPKNLFGSSNFYICDGN